MLNQVDPGRCVNEEGGRGQLWSPMEEDEEDAEECRHGGRDEMHSSSALHGVLLEGRGKANRICLNGTQKKSACARAHA